MKINAPFELKEVEIPTGRGQAAGTHWLLAPLGIRRLRLFGQVKTQFQWGYSVERAQFLGTLSEFAGKFTWRKF